MVLCWACWFTNYSNAQELIPGQVYQTGNIVVPTTTSSGSTWTGAVYQDQLTCWGQPGDTGYCGPQAIVRPGGNLNFSYGSTYVYQQQHINTILPAATGLQVNGYNFGFTAKNGNGWDDGRTDSLIALVRFWDNTGSKGANNLLYGTSYNLNSNFNWSTFNYSENFTKPLTATDIGLVQYGFIGRDNNGWAGPYGPELYGVNFSVKYSVDPCAANPLYSPTCKGYLDALAKLMPPAPATTNTVIAEYAPPPESAPPPPPPPGEPGGSQPQSGPPPPGAPPPPGQAPQQQTAQQTAPAATQASPQEKSSGAPANLGFALSLIAKNSEREKATAQQVVATAETQAQAAGDRAQATAQTTATAAVAQSTTSTEMGSSGTGIQASGSSSRSTVTLTTVQQQASTAAILSAQSFTSVANTQQNMGPQLQAPATFEQTQSTQTSGIFSTQEYRQQESEQITQTANFLTDLNSPLKQILDAQQVQQAQQDQPQQARNRDTTPNDLAVGVNLAQMATQPQGYANYTNFALKDASFYEIKEVYKNQKVVDNIRVLRGLGSDQKHQDLVNLQYK